MKRSISFFLRIAVFSCVLVSGAHAQDDCEAIKAEAYLDATDPNTIRIDLKGMSENDIVVSIFLPGAVHDLDTKKTFFTGLKKGKYLIVFSARNEQSNYCNKEVKLIIP